MGKRTGTVEDMVEIKQYGAKIMEDYGKLLYELQKIDARSGLPEEVFTLVSTLVPIANVDLFIRDHKCRILLSWRNDEFFGKGWHIPGGCIRFKETMLERLQKTADKELQTKVHVNPVPLAVRDVIVGKNEEEPKKRAHHLAVLYDCRLPKEYEINNNGLSETDAGYLKWFEKIPDNILKVHDCYRDIFEKYALL